MEKLITTACAILLFIGQAITQSGQLATLFNQGDFEKCSKQCALQLVSDPENLQANFYQGMSLVRLSEYREAETFLIKAKKLGFQPTTGIDVNLLRIFARTNREEQLVSYLEQIAKEGFSALAFLKSPEFKSFELNPEFQQARNLVEQNTYPCRFNPQYQKLDFWIGEWDIFNNGNKIAESIITKSNDGCTLHEDYSTVRGFFGRSINFHDVSDSLYTQIWIDQRNRFTRYKEKESRDGYLLMVADQGGGNLNRMSWTLDPDEGTVMQVAESSSDGGKIWNPGFSGLYKPRQSSLDQQLSDQLNQMEALYNENKMEAIADYYTADAQMLEPGGREYSGKETIRKYWKTLDGLGISWQLDLIEADGINDLAYSVVISELKYNSDGNETISKTKAMIIWEKTDQGYKIKKDFFHFIK